MHTLAADFINIARKAKGVESAANGMYSTLKAEDVRTLDHFNEKVRDAFQANGWSQTAGRPAAGSKEKPAPDAVKLYVSTFRAAYRMGLDVLSFETVGAMRTTIRERRQGIAHAAKPDQPPELKGIQLVAEHSLTGALWHDAVVLHQHLNADKQHEFEREVRMLMMRYSKDAPPELTVVPAMAA